MPPRSKTNRGSKKSKIVPLEVEEDTFLDKLQDQIEDKLDDIEAGLKQVELEDVGILLGLFMIYENVGTSTCLMIILFCAFCFVIFFIFVLTYFVILFPN